MAALPPEKDETMPDAPSVEPAETKTAIGKGDGPVETKDGNGGAAQQSSQPGGGKKKKKGKK
jgi:hypothetical protein